MKYMGSKNRISKEILPIILKDRKPDQWYVEPFVGGFNIIDKVDGNRIGNDNNYYLIELFKAIQNGWYPPSLITEDIYNEVRLNKDNYIPALVAYVGFCFSFGGKWFGGYRREKKGQKDNIENMKLQSERSFSSLSKQKEKIKDILLFNLNFTELEIPDNSIIYCDPPYKNTTKYKNTFDHDLFWDWIRVKVKEGHKVFVSEYESPDDFKFVWEKEVKNNIGTERSKRTERLFVKK